jgi:hypothetical protein
MSEIIDTIVGKIEFWVNSWGLWRMIHDENSDQSLNIEVEFKDGHREVISLSRET